MTPINVKSSTYFDSGIEISFKDPKFIVCDHVRISKYKNIFTKSYRPNWSDEDFLIKKIRNTIP